jgi:hypothetical protein
MGQVFKNVFMTMASGHIGTGNEKICTSCNKEEHLFPGGYQEKEKPLMTNEKLQALQEEAERLDLLLPTSLNQVFGERKIKPEDENILLPLNFNL